MKGEITRCSHGRDALFCHTCTIERLKFLPKETCDACAVLVEDFPVFVARGLISMEVATQVATLLKGLTKGDVVRCGHNTYKNDVFGKPCTVFCTKLNGHTDPCQFERVP